MSVLRRIARLFLVLPFAVVLVAVGVANSHWVRLSLDPFRPDDPVLWLELPLYAWLLGALILGVIVGGLATWLMQARWRRRQVSGVRFQGAGPRPAQALLLKPDR
jgi:lipopolysaccharide assembly LapA-like protein